MRGIRRVKNALASLEFLLRLPVMHVGRRQQRNRAVALRFSLA